MDKAASENFVVQQRRTWAQVKAALEYLGIPVTQGTCALALSSPSREIGEKVLDLALKWWRKVLLRTHPDKIRVSPLASQLTQDSTRRIAEAGDTLNHAKMHGWWATEGDSGRREVLERCRRQEPGCSLPWQPYGGATPPRPEFINELLREQHEKKHDSE